MNIKNQHISKGFILAGLTNIFGVFIFSRLFTNEFIPEFDSKAMSNFGLLMIVVWGLVFIAVAKSFYQVKWLVGVFVIEKFIYATHWAKWILSNNLTNVFEKDTMAGIYYIIYGINDWIFFLFFSFVFIRLVRQNNLLQA